MTRARRNAGWAVIALIVALPARGGVFSDLGIFDLLRPTAGYDAGLASELPASLDPGALPSAAVLLGGFAFDSDLFLPATERRTSAAFAASIALAGAPVACDNCAESAGSAGSANPIFRSALGRPLLLIAIAMGLIALIVLAKVVQYIHKMNVEEAYLKQRWGEKTKII